MKIDEVIKGDWASEPTVMDACLKVWHSLSARTYDLDHYTFSELAKIAETNDEELVSRALLYLATPKVKVLKTCLMYEFNGGFYELPEDEVSHYAVGQQVIHPEFGEPIPESEILLCFTLGTSLRAEGVA